MFHKSRIIVLYAKKYPKGYILHAYSREFGRITYALNNAKGHLAPIRRASLQPLSVLEIVAEVDSANAFPRIRESRAALIFNTLPYDFVKNTIAIFLAEWLALSLKEEQADERLFDFVEFSLRVLDEKENVANFHLQFLIRLTRFLGFEPNLEEKGKFFDFVEGKFCDSRPENQHFISGDDLKIFTKLMKINHRNMAKFKFSRQERTRILSLIIEYYGLHLPGFSSPKSLAILHELFE